MRTQIHYKLVTPGTKEFVALQEFAKTFGHTIHENPRINTYAMIRDNVLFGYFDHVFMPIVYPAFHPDFTNPRDIIRALDDVRASSEVNGNFMFVGVPTVEGGRPNFPDEVLSKIGLTKTNREVFLVTPQTFPEA
jgi:hypothetical protein